MMAMKKIYKFIMLALLAITVFATSGFTTSIKADQKDVTYDRIMKRGYIVLGTSPDYAPYEFQTTSNNKSKDVGMDISVAKDIADDLGVKLKIKNMDFDSLLVALQTGKVDMVLSGMNPSAARRKSVDFSDVYYKGGQSILINKKDAGIYKNKDSFKHKKIAAQTGSIQYNLAKKQIDGAKVSGIQKGADLILALQTNKVEGVVMEKPTAEAYAANNSGIKVIQGGFTLNDDETSTAVAMPKKFASSEKENKYYN
jgi:ABC-type amino acid transport substrate-binding protein